MRLDLQRALFSHCEHRWFTLPLAFREVFLEEIEAVVGAPVSPTRFVTYLQGAVTLTDVPVEFRAHLDFRLTAGHPSFPLADRGLAFLVRPANEDGPHGPTLAALGWLGTPIPPGTRLPRGWVGDMVRAQGYLTVPGAEWEQPAVREDLDGWWSSAFAQHIDGMVNATILEERLGAPWE
jgi:hypothetical protein